MHTRRSIIAIAGGAIATAAIPPSLAYASTADPIFAALDAYTRAWDASLFAEDFSEEVAERLSAATQALVTTRPTTPAGLAALTTWFRNESGEMRGNSLWPGDRICALSATIDDSARGMSGLSPWSPPAIVARAVAFDPIFVAIDVHKATCDAVHAELNQHIALERVGIKGRVDAKHDRELAACEARMDGALDEQTAAACALVNIAPITMSGLMALLQYAITADTDGKMWPDLVDGEPDGKTRSWHRFLIETLVDVLPGLAVRS